MSCEIRSEEHADRLLAYTAGRLRGEAAKKLELHMRSCEECAAIGRSQAGVWNLLDSWEAPPVSADFNRRLYAKIDAAASASWLERFGTAVNEFLRPVFARPALPLAAASLVIVVGFMLDHPKAKAPEATKIEVQVDQVEATLDDIDMLRQFETKQEQGSKENPSKSM